MTRKPSRLRRWMKWVGLVGCAVIVVAWVVNIRWTIGYSVGKLDFRLGAGRIGYDFGVRPIPIRRSPGLDIRPFGGGYWRRCHYWVMFHSLRQWGYSVRLPLWMPLVALAIPTAILWYRDRQPKPGHCQQCGYDLTGNESGVCPECGTEVKQP